MIENEKIDRRISFNEHFSFRYKDKKIVDILTSLTSRTKHAQVQLSAARTLTYIHRSGSLKSTDSKIVFKTLPTLARLCSVDYDEDIRAAAAESLAYLAEVSSNSSFLHLTY